MSVQPSIRPSTIKSETMPAGAGETAPSGDLFTLVVTGLIDGHASGPDVQDPTLSGQGGKTKAEPQPGTEVPASVAQLLALVTGSRGEPTPRQGKAKEAAPKDKPHAKTETAASESIPPAPIPVIPTPSTIAVPADPTVKAQPTAQPSPTPAVAIAPAVQPVIETGTELPPIPPMPSSAIAAAPAPLPSPSVPPLSPAASPLVAGIPAAVPAAGTPQAPAVVAAPSALAGAAPASPLAAGTPALLPTAAAAPPPPTGAVAAIPGATPSAPIAPTAAIATAQAADGTAAAAAQPLPSAPSKADAQPAIVPASPATPPDPGVVAAVVPSLPTRVAGVEAQKPAAVERGRAAPSHSPAAPAPAAAPPFSDAPILAAATPAPAADVQSSTAAPAAPLQGLVIERQLDLAHQQDWIDQLARDIATTAGDGKTLNFRLNPEHLGTLQVEIAQSHHGAAVRFSTDSEAARTLIADAQPRLVAEARAQGVRISEAHVDLSGSGSGDPRRQAAAAPDQTPVRTARSLQDTRTDDGKPSPNQRDLYA